MTYLSPKGNPVTFYILSEHLHEELGGVVPEDVAGAIIAAMPESYDTPAGCHIMIVGDFDTVEGFSPARIKTYEGLAADEGCTVLDILRITRNVECHRCPIPDCRSRHESFVAVFPSE